jgi:hypothetical protein
MSMKWRFHTPSPQSFDLLSDWNSITSLFEALVMVIGLLVNISTGDVLDVETPELVIV